MIVRKKDKVVVLGITGKQGMFWTEKMLGCGTNVVAGINPKRAGESFKGVPIFASTAEAAKAVGAHVAVEFIPPPWRAKLPSRRWRLASSCWSCSPSTSLRRM